MKLTKLITLNNSKSGEITFKLPNKRKLIKNMPLKSKKPLKKKLLITLLKDWLNSTFPPLLNKPKNNSKKNKKKKLNK
jgi:hypothetical protein